MTIVKELSKMIDHSILQPTHTDDDLLKMRAAGATRSGATATETILTYAKKRFETKNP